MKIHSKKIILKIHEILGLVTGLVVLIVALTGCCWAFKDEIQSLYMPDHKVIPKEADMITPTQARALATAVFPGKSVHGTLYGQPDEAVEVIFYEREPEFYQSVYLNPYTGEVISQVDHFTGFFDFVLDGHMYLWLPEEIGTPIVTYSILVFLISLISGLMLWWPKKKSNRKQRFSLDWKPSTKWKRKNFDLHAVAGFYACSIAFVIAFSGCIMAFDWFYYATYKTLGGDNNPRFIIPQNESGGFQQTEDVPAIDRIIPMLIAENPEAVSFEVHYPHDDSSTIYVEVSNQAGVYYNSDYRFFDQNTMKEIPTPSVYGKYQEAGFADKAMRMNYDIHIGAIGGIFGKILAFLISLICATLPVTGFLLWWGRRNKASAKKPGTSGKTVNPIKKRKLQPAPQLEEVV